VTKSWGEEGKKRRKKKKKAPQLYRQSLLCETTIPQLPRKRRKKKKGEKKKALEFCGRSVEIESSRKLWSGRRPKGKKKKTTKVRGIDLMHRFVYRPRKGKTREGKGRKRREGEKRDTIQSTAGGSQPWLENASLRSIGRTMAGRMRKKEERDGVCEGVSWNSFARGRRKRFGKGKKKKKKKKEERPRNSATFACKSKGSFFGRP